MCRNLWYYSTEWITKFNDFKHDIHQWFCEYFTVRFRPYLELLVFEGILTRYLTLKCPTMYTFGSLWFYFYFFCPAKGRSPVIASETAPRIYNKMPGNTEKHRKIKSKKKKWNSKLDLMQTLTPRFKEFSRLVLSRNSLAELIK